jgi:RNA polymerase sigma-70 factor (ECF subfamily)
VPPTADKAPAAEAPENPADQVVADPALEGVPGLDGEWRLIAVEINGKRRAEEDTPDLRGTRFVFQGESLSIGGPPGLTRDRRKRCTFDSSRLSGQMDMTSLDGKESGQTHACLYELVQDRLTICVPDKPDAERPTDFSTRPGDGRTVFILKRAQP